MVDSSSQGYGSWRRTGSSTIPSEGENRVTYGQWRRETPGGGEENVLLPEGQNPSDSDAEGSVGMPRNFSEASTPFEAQLNVKLADSEKAGGSFGRSVPLVEYGGRFYPNLSGRPDWVPKAVNQDFMGSIEVSPAFMASSVGKAFSRDYSSGFGGGVKGEDEPEMLLGPTQVIVREPGAAYPSRAFVVSERKGVVFGVKGDSFKNSDYKQTMREQRLDLFSKQLGNATLENAPFLQGNEEKNYFNFEKFVESGGKAGSLSQYGGYGAVTGLNFAGNPVYGALGFGKASLTSQVPTVISNFPLNFFAGAGKYGVAPVVQTSFEIGYAIGSKEDFGPALSFGKGIVGGVKGIGEFFATPFIAVAKGEQAAGVSNRAGQSSFWGGQVIAGRTAAGYVSEQGLNLWNMPGNLLAAGKASSRGDLEINQRAELLGNLGAGFLLDFGLKGVGKGLGAADSFLFRVPRESEAVSAITTKISKGAEGFVDVTNAVGTVTVEPTFFGKLARQKTFDVGIKLGIDEAFVRAANAPGVPLGTYTLKGMGDVGGAIYSYGRKGNLVEVPLTGQTLATSLFTPKVAEGMALTNTNRIASVTEIISSANGGVDFVGFKGTDFVRALAKNSPAEIDILGRSVVQTQPFEIFDLPNNRVFITEVGTTFGKGSDVKFTMAERGQPNSLLNFEGVSAGGFGKSKSVNFGEFQQKALERYGFPEKLSMNYKPEFGVLIEAKAESYGMYDPNSGRMFLNFQEISKSGNILDTVFHEFGHKIDFETVHGDFNIAAYPKLAEAGIVRADYASNFFQVSQIKAEMFKAYFRSPDIFKKVAPETFSEMTGFLKGEGILKSNRPENLNKLYRNVVPMEFGINKQGAFVGKGFGQMFNERLNIQGKPASRFDLFGHKNPFPTEHTVGLSLPQEVLTFRQFRSNELPGFNQLDIPGQLAKISGKSGNNALISMRSRLTGDYVLLGRTPAADVGLYTYSSGLKGVMRGPNLFESFLGKESMPSSKFSFERRFNFFQKEIGDAIRAENARAAARPRPVLQELSITNEGSRTLTEISEPSTSFVGWEKAAFYGGGKEFGARMASNLLGQEAARQVQNARSNFVQGVDESFGYAGRSARLASLVGLSNRQGLVSGFSATLTGQAVGQRVSPKLFSQTSTRLDSLQNIFQKQKVEVGLFQRQFVGQDLFVGSLSRVAVSQLSDTIQLTKLFTETRQVTKSKTAQATDFFPTNVLIPKFPTREFIFNFPSGLMQFPQPKHKRSGKKGRQPLAYAPSLAALEFGIGGKQPRKGTKFTGLELFRPKFKKGKGLMIEW